MSLLIFILILTGLIVVHEFGHLFAAKLFGIKVEEFGIGFPPRLLSLQWGETRYSINLLFFGGFVRIFGERKDEAGSNPRAFASKSRPKQAAVIAAGIVMNILFAWLVLSAGYMAGLPTSAEHVGFGIVSDVHATIVGVLPDSPAKMAGLLPGDVVENIDTGTATLQQGASSADVQAFIAEHQEESIIFTVLRDGAKEHFLAKAEVGLVAGRKAVGINLDDVGTLILPPYMALLEGGILTYRMTLATAEGLIQFFSGLFSGAGDFADIAGPIGIAGIGSRAVANGFAAAVTLTALISINLALLNILPIPGLDGGRLFFILIESVVRRPLPHRLTLWFTVGGFALLIALMMLVSFHDITRLIG